MPIIGSKGQVVIPAQIRKRYGLKPGMEVGVEKGRRGPVIIGSLKHIRALRGKYKGKFTLKDFLADRNRERDREGR